MLKTLFFVPIFSLGYFAGFLLFKHEQGSDHLFALEKYFISSPSIIETGNSVPLNRKKTTHEGECSSKIAYFIIKSLKFYKKIAIHR